MHRHGYIGRKKRLPRLKEKPAIVLAPFGSTSRGKAALSMILDQVQTEYGDSTYIAYSSAIIRKREGLPSLHQTLAQAEADGYRRVVVQPLHVFAGTEYQQIAETCEYYPGLRTFVSETLMHRWQYVRKTLEVVSREFLAPDEGINLLALHGTPLASDPVNVVYLGLERMVEDLYANTFVASVEGIPDFDCLFNRLQRNGLPRPCRRVRIIPMMYLAGVHVEEDIMGLGDSWRGRFEQVGMAVDCPQVEHDGATYLKGLGFYPEIVCFFHERLRRTMELAKYY